LVWEQVVARFGPTVTWYDVNAEGLLLWRNGRYAAAELYRLRDTSANASWAPPPYCVTEVSPATRDEVFFSRSRLTWDAWVQMWQDTSEGESSQPDASLMTKHETPKDEGMTKSE